MNGKIRSSKKFQDQRILEERGGALPNETEI